MRVRCSATADYRSNAVGTLELDCKPDGLGIALRGVSSYREGYAPGPPVHADAVTVPWSSVYATRLGEDALLLSVDARHLPLNRFLLEGFSEPPPPAPVGSRAPRALALTALAAGALSLGAVLALSRALPHPRALGTFGMAIGLVALVSVVILVRARSAPRRSPAELLSKLSYELGRHLPNHIAAEPRLPPPRRLEPAALSAFLPRSAVGIAITLAATTLAALVGSSAARPRAVTEAVAASRSALTPETPRHESEPTDGAASLALAGAGDQAPGSPPLRTPTLLAFGARCECARDETLLWREPLPRSTALVLDQKTNLHDGHRHTELELALVNDGAEPAENIDLSVAFFEERGGARAGQWQTGERPLHFPGPLVPGGSIRWHVEGRGTSFEVIGPDVGTLAPDGSDAAPAEAFAALASAGPRPLRLHAARLLAFLGDARAESALVALRAGASPEEARHLDRLAAAPRDVATCQVRVNREGTMKYRLDACVFNRAAQARAELTLAVRAFDAGFDALRPEAREPRLLADYRTELGRALEPRSGHHVSLAAPLALAPGQTPRAFELIVDREEALP